MRAYYGDRIRMKIQAGGDEESHTVNVAGMKWLQAGSGYGFSPNSGWRNAQHAGISEQFAFATPAMPLTNIDGATQADYLYAVNASMDGYWNGSWGLMRTYNLVRNDLFRLPNTIVPLKIENVSKFTGSCPTTAPVRTFDVTAVLANDVLGNAVGAIIVPADPTLAQQHAGAPLVATGGTLVFNPRKTDIAALSKPNDLGGAPFTQAGHAGGVLHDPTAILYVRTADLVARSATDPRCLVSGKAHADPVHLPGEAPRPGPGGAHRPARRRGRLHPGDAAQQAAGQHARPAHLQAPSAVHLPGWRGHPGRRHRDGRPRRRFNNNHVRPSAYVGMRPALVAHNIRSDAGMVAGNNPVGNVAAPGTTVSYRWYAGDISLSPVSASAYNFVATPVEFGGTNLFPADPIKQGQKGLGGSLVIHPQGTTWTETDYVVDNQADRGAIDCSTVTPATAAANPGCRETRTSATVAGSIRDFVALIQKGMSHRYGDGEPVEQIASETSVAEDAEDSGEMAMNYRSDPLWFRFGMAPERALHRAGAELPDHHQRWRRLQQHDDRRRRSVRLGVLRFRRQGGPDPPARAHRREPGQRDDAARPRLAAHALRLPVELHGDHRQLQPHRVPAHRHGHGGLRHRHRTARGGLAQHRRQPHQHLHGGAGPDSARSALHPSPAQRGRVDRGAGGLPAHGPRGLRHHGRGVGNPAGDPVAIGAGRGNRCVRRPPGRTHRA